MVHPAAGDASVKISRWTLLWILVVGVLAATELGVLTGVINASNLIASFFTFVVALVVVSILSIIGAVFVGMFVSHRILSGEGFPPLGQGVARLRQGVRGLAARAGE